MDIALLSLRIELIGGVVLLAVLVGILWLLWQVLRQQGRLLLRIDAVESRLGQAGLVASATGLPGLPTVPLAAASQRNGHGAPAVPRPPTGLKIGDAAPDFSLPDLSGNLVHLSDFRGQETLVLFWRPGCGFCQRMLPDLQAWEAQSSEGAPRLLVVSSESVASNQAMGLRSPIVLDQAGRSIGSQFGASGTPMAVLVDAEGRIASELAAGAPAVLALARRRQEKTPLGWSADSAARAQKTRRNSPVEMSRTWGIQTIYLPRENLRFLEEWLAYHSLLGAEYFYLYDNTGSRTGPLGNCVAINGKNKYGMELDFRLTDDEIADIEAEIFKKYPVTKVKWQPQRNGEIIYGPVEACDHFSDLVHLGWCAFLDMDEFLYSPYEIGEILEGKAMVLLQKKFEDRFRYHSALEITKTFSIQTERWGSKLLINMAHYLKGGKTIHDLNVHRLAPLIANMDLVRFNHYNHNRIGHDWLLRHYHDLDPNWRPVPFEKVFTERCEVVWNRSKRIDYSSFVPIPPPGKTMDRLISPA